MSILYPEFARGSVAADPKAFVNAADNAAMRTLLGLGPTNSPTFAGLTLTGALTQANGQSIGWSDAKIQRLAAGSAGIYAANGTTLGAWTCGSMEIRGTSTVTRLTLIDTDSAGAGAFSIIDFRDSNNVIQGYIGDISSQNADFSVAALMGNLTLTAAAASQIVCERSVAIRNSTVGQKLQVAKAYTSTTSHEQFEIDAATDASNFDIAILSGSLGGSNRSLRIGSKYAGAATLTPWLSFSTVGAMSVAATVETPFTITHTNGTSFRLVTGAGSAASTGRVELQRNSATELGFDGTNVFFRRGSWLTVAPGTPIVIGSSVGGAASALGNAVTITSGATTAGVFTATSGIQNQLNIGTASNETWSPSSGTAQWNLIRVAPAINTSGTYSGIVRGFWWNPTLTSTTGVDHRAIEIATGNCLFGTTSGNVGFGLTAPGALADIAASTTARASLRIRSGTAPTSPNDGDIWNDGTDALIRLGGVTYKLDKTAA